MSCTAPADIMCTTVMKGTPVAMCSGGKWGPCTCAAAQTSGQSSAGGAAVAAPASCGNGKAEGDEQCDGSDLKGMTCASMGMGTATAILKCNSRCAYDTLMCFAGATPNGGTGAGGTGARTTGTTTGAAGSAGKAGSGGSGR